MKNQKGITLVALVVTIIVLLILAGVSLNLVSGSNGILTRATSAADRNLAASAGEQVELLIADLQAEYYEGVYVTGDIKTEDYSTADAYILHELPLNTTSAGYTVAISGTTVTVSDDGTAIATNTLTSTSEAKFSGAWQSPS